MMVHHHRGPLGGAIPKDCKFERFQTGVDVFQLVVTGRFQSFRLGLSSLLKHPSFCQSTCVMPAGEYYSINGTRFQHKSQFY